MENAMRMPVFYLEIPANAVLWRGMDEKEIIAKVLAGEREEFAELIRLHQNKVMSLCLSLLRDPVEAEDAAQAIFIKAYEHLSQFYTEWEGRQNRESKKKFKRISVHSPTHKSKRAVHCYKFGGGLGRGFWP